MICSAGPSFNCRVSGSRRRIALSGSGRGLQISVSGGGQNNGIMALVAKFINARGSLGRLNGLLGDGYKMNNSTGSKRVVVRKSFGAGIVRLLIERKCAGAGNVKNWLVWGVWRVGGIALFYMTTLFSLLSFTRGSGKSVIGANSGVPTFALASAIGKAMGSTSLGKGMMLVGVFTA